MNFQQALAGMELNQAPSVFSPHQVCVLRTSFPIPTFHSVRRLGRSLGLTVTCKVQWLEQFVAFEASVEDTMKAWTEMLARKGAPITGSL